VPSSSKLLCCDCREESGSCYALDIGGTNFRVAYYKLSDKHGKVVRI
jgi:hexokinase